MTAPLRSPGLILAGILLLAFGLRLGFLYSWSQSAYHACPILDSSTFQELGRRLAGEGLSGLGLIWRPPLYPLFLGVLWGGLGESLLLPLVIQVFLATVSVGLLYRIAREVTGENPALLATGLFAVSWTSIFFSAQYLIATLFTVLCLGTLLALLKSRERGRVGLVWAGVLAGLTALARPTILPCVAAWTVWVWLTREERRVESALIFLVSCLLWIAPATWHNYRVSGLFIPISAIGGYNLYIGNGPGSDGKTVWSAQPALEGLAVDSDLDPLESQRLYLRATWGEIQARPKRWLGLMGRKLYYLGNSFEISSNVDIYTSVSAVAPWLAFLALLPFGVLLPFAFLGLPELWKRGKRGAPVGIFLLVFPATLVLFFVNARFRVPLVPLVCLLASMGFFRLWEDRSQLLSRSWARLLVLGILLVVCNGRAFQIDDPRDLQEVDLRHGGAFLKGGFTWDAQVMAEHILVQDMGCRPAISLRAEAMKISEEWRRARASSLVNSAAPASGRKDPQ